jgi:HTH-type transcriptional regulator/antitoxin HigA
MTASPTINRRRYAKLLAKTLPVVIETEAENERMLAGVEKLFDKGDKLTAEEQVLLKLMTHLIQDFEDKHYQLNASTPRSILLELMEARNVKPRDLWRLFGSKGTASEVINGKRSISKTQARALADFFKVSPELFI